MSELLTLPLAHPLGGYVTPDRSGQDGVGTLPQEEIDIATARDEARETDASAVAQYEHDTATTVRDERLDESGLRVAALIPNWASIKGTELVLLQVCGKNFTRSTQIWWHDHLEPTDFVSDTLITTWVTPWLFLVPDVIDVGVKETAIGEESDGDKMLLFNLTP